MTGTPRPTTTEPAATRPPGQRSHARPTPRPLTALAGAWPARRRRCWSPGPTSTPPEAGTPPSPWPRSSGCRCGPARPPAARGSGFPERHPNFVGVLPPAIGAAVRDAQGPRPGPGRRLLGVPLLPLPAGTAAGRGQRAGRPHQRSRRGRPGTDGRRHRRRRGARARAPGRAGARRRRAPRPSRARTRATRQRPTRRPQRLGGDGGARRCLAPTTRSPSWRRRRARCRCATGCGISRPAATTSAPAAGSASGSRPPSASSWPSPTGRSCACSARARPSTGSPRCGARWPTRRRSRSSCCATTST